MQRLRHQRPHARRANTGRRSRARPAGRPGCSRRSAAAMRERRIEQAQQAGLAVDQVRFERRHRRRWQRRAARRRRAPPRPARSGRCGIRRWRASRAARRRRRRRAGTTAPSQPAPCSAARQPRARVVASARRARASPRCSASGAKRSTTLAQEPGEPDRFAAALRGRRGSCRRSSRRCPSAAGRARRSRRLRSIARAQCS